ncbi:type I-G CRISPR-associated protein Csb2 [Brevibacterium salitolerans]|uniref:Type I-U CRISPR-associated protein Cas5/Cas6 n=1 Tax=Brevibacterium salitolerans TaxID=1403566 RepID=A0ABN2WKT9_9MICO
MAIAVTVRLLRPAFHGLDSQGQAQWPPAPVRLLGALKAGAHALGDSQTAKRAHTALARIAGSPPPVIHTPEAKDLRIPGTYTDRTWLPEKLTSAHGSKPEQYLGLEAFGLDSKNRDLKPQGAMALAGHVIDVHVDVDLSSDEIEALDAAAALVPYFGRSQDHAMLQVRPVERGSTPSSSCVSWYPREDAAGQTRGWQPNTIEWMDENYTRVFGEDPALRVLPPLAAVAYTRSLTYHRVRVRKGSMTVIPLETSIEQHRVQKLFLEMSRLMPSGWHVFPLTVSGHAAADGRLVGVGLLGPEGHDWAQSPAQLVLEAVANANLPSGRSVRLSGAHEPSTWENPSRRWISTTPLRGFPDARVLSHVLAEEIAARYGSASVVLDAQASPVRAQDHRWSSEGLTDGFGQWWVTIETADEIEGPLMLGASTDRGFGMFRPIDSAARSQS